MRRKHASQNTAEAVEDKGTRHRLGQEDTIEFSHDRDRISMADIEFEAGREIVEPKDRKTRQNIAV